MIKNLTLTHEEQNTIYNLLHSTTTNPTNRDLSDAICKAQCLKMLKILVEKGYLKHEFREEGLISTENPYHKKECWLCIVEKSLE